MYTEENIKELERKVKAIQTKYKEAAELNQLGIKLEKEGNVDEAAVIYEYLILNSFDGSHPYDRLLAIYKKQKQKENIIRILEKAVWVFENVVYEKRADRKKKLEKYKEKLDKERS